MWPFVDLRQSNNAKSGGGIFGQASGPTAHSRRCKRKLPWKFLVYDWHCIARLPRNVMKLHCELLPGRRRSITAMLGSPAAARTPRLTPFPRNVCERIIFFNSVRSLSVGTTVFFSAATTGWVTRSAANSKIMDFLFIVSTLLVDRSNQMVSYRGIGSISQCQW
jgi:hypothetical protein